MHLSRLSRIVFVFFVLLTVGVLAVSAQDATAQPVVPGLATATPKPGIPGLPNAAQTKEYTVGPFVVTIPDSWQVWDKKANGAVTDIQLMDYGTLAAKSQAGTVIQASVIPKDVVLSQFQSVEADVIFTRYGAQKVSNEVGLSFSGDAVWLILPTNGDLVILNVVGNKDNAEVATIFATVHPVNKQVDDTIAKPIAAFLAKYLVQAPVVPLVTEDPVGTAVPTVGKFDMKIFFPTAEEIGLDSSFVLDSAATGTYDIDKLTTTLNGIYGSAFTDIIVNAGKRHGFVEQEVIAWATANCALLELDVVRFDDTKGATDYLADTAVNQAWIDIGLYQSNTPAVGGLIASGVITTACGTQANNISVQFVHKNYIVVAHAVSFNDANKVESALESVVQYMVGKIN